MLKSSGRGMHHSLLSPGTGDFTHFHLHKNRMPRSSPNGGLRGFQMTGALQPPSQPCFVIRLEFVYYSLRGFFRWILGLFSFVKKEQLTFFCFNLIICAKL